MSEAAKFDEWKENWKHVPQNFVTNWNWKWQFFFVNIAEATQPKKTNNHVLDDCSQCVERDWAGARGTLSDGIEGYRLFPNCSFGPQSHIQLSACHSFAANASDAMSIFDAFFGVFTVRCSTSACSAQHSRRSSRPTNLFAKLHLKLTLLCWMRYVNLVWRPLFFLFVNLVQPLDPVASTPHSSEHKMTTATFDFIFFEFAARVVFDSWFWFCFLWPIWCVLAKSEVMRRQLCVCVCCRWMKIARMDGWVDWRHG